MSSSKGILGFLKNATPKNSIAFIYRYRWSNRKWYSTWI